MSQLIDNDFYVGLDIENIEEYGGNYYRDDFWKFNFNTKSWSLLGNFNDSKLSLDFLKDRRFIKTLSNYKFSLVMNKINMYGMDIKNNVLYSFPDIAMPFVEDLYNLQYNAQTDLFLFTHSNNQKFNLRIPKVVTSK